MIKRMLKYFINGFTEIVNHKQVINLIAFVLCILIIGILNIFTKDTLVSEQENRILEQNPEFRVDRLFSGEYFKDFENYFADQFFARESFVTISSRAKEAKGFPSMQDVQIITAGGFNALEGHAVVNPDDFKNETSSQSGSPSLTADTEVPAALTGSTAVGNGTANPVTTNLENSNPGTTNPDAAVAPLADGQATAAPDKENPVNAHPSPIENGPSPTKKPDRDDNGKTINRILIYKNSAYAIFPFSEDSGNYYASTLNQFSEKVGEEVTVYSLLSPTSMEFIDQEKYKTLSDSQKETIEYVNTRLKKVVPVDAYTPLQKHKDEYVYFRTDHHWTALGAYYAYTGFARAAGMEPVTINNYETETIHEYVGSMYETTGSSNLKRNPDTITVYKPFVKNEYNVYYGGPIKMNVIDMSHASKKIKYRVFLSGDRPLGVIQTENTNGKKILVIKDSYGNAMVPFLLPHYQEIYVIDPRQYEKNIYTLIQENQIQEVLFLNYIPILSYYGYIDQLVKVMESEE